MLALGSNIDNDATAHPNIAWRSQLANKINSDLMFMYPKAVTFLLIYTRPATVMFSSTFDNECRCSALMLLGSPKLPDNDPA